MSLRNALSTLNVQPRVVMEKQGVAFLEGSELEGSSGIEMLIVVENQAQMWSSV